MKTTIWSNYDFNIYDWSIADYEENLEVNGLPPRENVDYDDEEFCEWCWTVNQSYLDDELGNLSHIDGETSVVASLERWDGTKIAIYKWHDTLAESIKELCYGYDLVDIYVDDDDREVHLDGYHHDGCDRFVLRKTTDDGCSTSYADDVCDVYGWCI